MSDEVITSLDLNLMLKELAEERLKLSKIQDIYKERLDLFNAINSTLKEEISTQQHQVSCIESDVRGESIRRFNETGEKNQCTVKIIQKQLMEFKEEEALAWCIAHNLFLKYDKAAFSKHAKDNPVEFVTYSSEPQARIPSKIEVE